MNEWIGSHTTYSFFVCVWKCYPSIFDDITHCSYLTCQSPFYGYDIAVFLSFINNINLIYQYILGDSLAKHNGRMFSTKDKNYIYCAKRYSGAWWYFGCFQSQSNLNGQYLSGRHESGGIGVNWGYWRGYGYSLQSTRMMFRRA